MRINLFSPVVLLLLVGALAGCGSGSGSGSGSGTGSNGGSGGTGGGPSFQPRPFPGDFAVTPPMPGVSRYLPANVVYDAQLKEFFFSNSAMNEVEVYSTVDGHRVGAISVPGPFGLSLSPDGSELAVGTTTPYIYFANPATLHVTSQVLVPASVLDPKSGFEPVMPYLMASGPMLIGTFDPRSTSGSYSNAISSGSGSLISFDRGSDTFAQASPNGPGSVVSSAVPSRSLDGNYLAVETGGQTGFQLAVYSASTQTYVGFSPGQYGLLSVAANPDGSQFATSGTPTFGSGQFITFWDRTGQQQSQYASTQSNILYSRDGKYLYVREQSDVLALDAKTGLASGYQGLTIAGSTQVGVLWDVDETNRVYGNVGLSAFVASVANLQSTAPVMPVFNEMAFGFSYGNPNEGPLSGGTDVQFIPGNGGAGSADGISSTTEAYFGSTPATKDVVAPYPSSSDGFSFLTATAPPTATNGPVTVLLTDANNNAALIPRAYSYGPHAQWIDPSAVSPNGTNGVTLVADGIDPFQFNNPNVAIDGVVQVVVPSSVRGGPFWNSLILNTMGINPGWRDVKIYLQDGTSETTKNMVQVLAKDVTLSSLAYTSAVYDTSRDRFYLTGADNTVAVFDPESQTLLQPMTSSTISSGAVLGSVALTPDSSKLLVSDPTDQSVVVFDLTSGTSTSVSVLLASDQPALIMAPMPVVALSGNRAFVLLTPWGQNQLREIDLTQMKVTVRTDWRNPGSSPLNEQSMTASSDGSMALLSATSGAGIPPYSVWRYDAATDAFGPSNVENNAGGYFLAANADGSVENIGVLMLDRNQLPLVPIQYAGNNSRLTASGGLLYRADTNVGIVDTRNGRLLLSTPYFGATAKALAIDPTGTKFLACAGTSLRYFELAVVPLAVGTISPANATQGSSITVSGDGFVSGTTALIGGKSAICSTIDSQTINCVVPDVNTGLEPMTLRNPDGQTYSIEGAVNVQ